MDSPRTSETPTLSAKRVTEGLLVLGAALLVYWQPLSKSIPLKASDGVLALAICLWMFSAVREQRVPVRLEADVIAFIGGLLASILLATTVGYVRYHLAMSRTGTILLARLLMCIALFLVVRSFLREETPFRRRLALAFLSPLALFPALLIPRISATMWDQIGRLRGFTVNANTAAVAFLIAFAFAFTLTAYEAGLKRRARVVCFFIVTVGTLTLILWTQSRAYFVAAFASAVFGTVLIAQHHGLPRLKLAVAAVAGFALIIAGIFVFEPRGFATAQLIRLSPVYRTSEVPPGAKASPHPSAPGWTMNKLQQFLEGGIRKIEGDTRMLAIRYYSKLLSTNYWGFGVNFETKFTFDDPETGIRHGPNTILDLPIYGGVGLVASMGYLAWLIARRTKRTLTSAIDENVPYTVAAVTALVGLWVAALLVGSPLFDYQFWILTAIALT